MGIDLKMLPVEGGKYSFTVLSMDRDTELFDHIGAIEDKYGYDVPEGFKSLVSPTEDSNWEYGPTPETAHGERIKMVKVQHFVPLMMEDVLQASSRENKAVFAYLSHLRITTDIALYWC